MEEHIFSGYCRQIDSARTVLVEIDHGEVDPDCAYCSCEFANTCPIGRQIADLG